METYLVLTMSWTYDGPHNKLTLFVGEPEKTKVNIGTLVMTKEEACRMRTTLRSGAGVSGVGVFNGVLEHGWLEEECEFCGDPATRIEQFDRAVFVCDRCAVPPNPEDE
jgi:hypothetical protein